MKLEYPKELDQMLHDNPNLEVLIVATVFDKSQPMTKKKKRELAHNVYESALKQLDSFKPTLGLIREY